jgi:uncharacterized membrane protein
MFASLGISGLIHLGAVVPALGIGAAILARGKGTPWHIFWGRVWVGLMVTADVSAFWLQRDGFSWIHALAVINLVSIAAGIVCIRARRRAAHAAFVVGAYAGALIAGVGAFTSGRFLHQIFFG